MNAFADALAGRTTEVAIPVRPERPTWLKPAGIGAVAILLGAVGWIAFQGGNDPVSLAATVEDTTQAPALAAIDDSGKTVGDSGASVPVDDPEPVTVTPPTTTQTRQAPPTPEPQAATLFLRVNVAALIYIDDVFRIERNGYRETLGLGTHRITLERDGYVTLDTLITFVAGENLIDLTMERQQ